MQSRSIKPEAVLTFGALGVVALAATPVSRLLLPAHATAPEVALLYADGALALWVGSAALTLLLSLRVGRSHLPTATSVALIAGIWLLFWGLTGHSSALALSPGVVHYAPTLLKGALAAFATAPILARIYVVRRWAWQQRRMVGSIWTVPGLVLFCGIGALWLMDYAAHGPARFRVHTTEQSHYALRQAVDIARLFTLVSLLTPVSGSMLRSLMRALSWFDRSTQHRLFLTGAGCAWAALLTVTYKATSAHIVGELLRLPYLVILSWWCYRWIDSSMSFRRLVVATSAAWSIFAIACLLIRESGQLLLCTTVTAATLCGLRSHVSIVHRGWRGPLATALTASVMGLLGASVFVVGAASPHVAARILAVEQPFSAPVDFLAINKWFIAEAGWTGFGLGHVPWCGYAGSLAGACTGAAGLPQQLPMDYVFVGLSGIWGLAGALALTTALILWLAAIGAAAGRSGGATAMSIQHLRNWLVGIWCLSMLVQVFLTAMGSLGAFPLTGLPLPFVSIGRMGIFSSAFVIALAATDIEKEQR